jgi:hypothetical protein
MQPSRTNCTVWCTPVAGVILSRESPLHEIARLQHASLLVAQRAVSDGATHDGYPILSM